MNTQELLNDPKTLANSQDMLKDLLQKDPDALKQFDALGLDMKAIKTAIDFLTSQDHLSDNDKTKLLEESWRINFKAKPPTPEEFITEKYLGPAANSTFPWIKKIFKEFMDPQQAYRNLILYPHVGFGKAEPLYSNIYTSETETKTFAEIKPGDKVLSPDGTQTEVLATIDWPEDDIYELELEDGRTFRCGINHLHYVSYRQDEFGEPIWENVETKFILEHPEIEFEFTIYHNKQYHLSLSNVNYIGKEPSRCISVANPNGLYVTDNHIVTHNSYLSTIITLYIATHLNLMRNPWKYFGLNPATQISQMLVSYSLKKSSELLLEPFLSLLEASPFFERVQRQDSMKQLEEEFKHQDTIDKLYWTTAYPTSALGFSSGSTIKIASNPGGLLGLTIVSIVYSELAFFTDAGKSSEFIMRLYNDGKARVRSRLETSAKDPVTGDKVVNYYGRTILDSSPNDLNNAIDDYIVNESHKDRTVYKVEGSRWKWRPDEYADDFAKGDIFKVFTGGRGIPPRILEDNDPLLHDDTADQSKIITVPGSFRLVFTDDLPKALKDWAGIPTGSSNNLIYDYTIIENAFDNNFKNIYTTIEAPAKENPKGLIWNQVANTFFKKRGSEYEYYYKPWVPRVVSVDQSYSTDVTSISMSHVERYGDTGEFMYVVDFTIPILPTKSDNVNLEAIKEFIIDLRNKGNLRIEHVSFDKFQSETTIQNLKREGFDVEKLSVDTSMDPYLNVLSLLNRGMVSVGKNIFLKNNLKSLIIVRSKGKTGKQKIDHDNSREQVVIGSSAWKTSFLGSYGKDVSDSMCASIELCRKHYLVVEENWSGGPSKDAISNVASKKEALAKTNNLLQSLGLRI